MSLRTGLLTFLRPAMALLFPLRVIGREHVPSKGAVLLCCNHISLMDPVFLLRGMCRPLCFMAKAELFRSRIGNWFFRHMGAFPVERERADRKALQQGIALLQDGVSVGIFPEGRINRTSELLPFKKGVSLLAQRGKAPVLPACLMTKNGRVRPFRVTTLVLGEPLTDMAEATGRVTTRRERDAARLREAIDRLRQTKPSRKG